MTPSKLMDWPPEYFGIEKFSLLQNPYTPWHNDGFVVCLKKCISMTSKVILIYLKDMWDINLIDFDRYPSLHIYKS